MSRPVTLFTGQWADLPVPNGSQGDGAWGFDGVELACWGDHFEVDRAVADAATCQERGTCWRTTTCNAWPSALIWSASGVGPHRRAAQGNPAPEVWGDGDPEGVRQRAAEE